MSSFSPEQITDEQVRTFWADGAICLRGLFSRAWVERMREAVEEALAKPGPTSAPIATSMSS